MREIDAAIDAALGWVDCEILGRWERADWARPVWWADMTSDPLTLPAPDREWLDRQWDLVRGSR